MNDFQRNLLDIEILSTLEIRDTLVTRVTNNLIGKVLVCGTFQPDSILGFSGTRGPVVCPQSRVSPLTSGSLLFRISHDTSLRRLSYLHLTVVIILIFRRV
jgi:hypothetical protein